jgi:hypothetical protein
MTKIELERKVAEIEANGGDDAPHRIQTLRAHFEKQQREEATRAAEKQQRAEANLRADLKRAYMRNPAASEASFEADYPELRRQKLVGEALKAEAVASRQQRAATREAF